MKFLILSITAIAAQTCFATAGENIQNHEVQKRFLEEPCQAVIDTIDNPIESVVGIGEMAMTFGFLMGVEALNPGIRGESETILMRLRHDCRLYPNKTAMTLLM
jgi:hypothetical protein